MLRIFFCLITLILQTTLQAQQIKTDNKELEKYVGYYHVGIRPNQPLFYARAYVRNNHLFMIFDGDKDHQLTQESNNFFYLSSDTSFQYPIEFYVENGAVKGFKASRPRDRWRSDLFAQKDESLSTYAVDTEKGLENSLRSQHFTIYYGGENLTDIERVRTTLEDNYLKLGKAFLLDSVANVTIRIYPDLATYHNSVLTPNAPQWQTGRSWTAEEIRIASPLVVKQDFDIAEFILHEYVHCITWQYVGKSMQTPGWLWEGAAMYKGCCKPKAPKELGSLKDKKHPSLRAIENDRSSHLKYEIGYYLVEYITEKYGWDKVLALLKTNGDIRSTLSISLKDFEKTFYSFLDEKYLNKE